MNLAGRLGTIEAQVCDSRWPGHEHFRGYAVMVQPFTSGHLLGLRVFPQNDFAPYSSVWHRTPAGAWSIYNDGPLKTGCPRAWGPVLSHAERTSIELDWTGPNQLSVRMDRPKLDWSMTIFATPFTRVVNALNAAMPFWTWKREPLLRIREWMARSLFEVGDLWFSFVTPTGRSTVVMPKRMYFLKQSRAVWRDQELGASVILPQNPTIGDVPLPTRPIFVELEAYGRIDDYEEFERTRREVAR